MSEQERENFIKGAVNRAPGKRLIQPSNALFDEEFNNVGMDDDDDDSDFIGSENSVSDESNSDETDSNGGYMSGPESGEISESLTSNGGLGLDNVPSTSSRKFVYRRIVPQYKLQRELTPAFSVDFVNYLTYRDNVVLIKERKILSKLNNQKEQLLSNKTQLEKNLQMLTERHNELNEKITLRHEMFKGLKSTLRTISPSLVKEEVNSKKYSILDYKSPEKCGDTLNTSDGSKDSSKILHSNQSSSKTIFDQDFNIKEKVIQIGHYDDKHKKINSRSTLPLSELLSGNRKFNSKPVKRRATADGVTYSKLQITEPKELSECAKCKSMKEPHLLINCETCNNYYHLGCLDPPLEKMPAKNKFSRFECSDCAEKQMEAEETDLKAKVKEATSECSLALGRSRRQHRAKLFE